MKRKMKQLLTLALAISAIALTSFSIFANTPAPKGKAVGAFDAPTFGPLSTTTFQELSNGYLGGIALDSEGGVWTWGWNGHGQLGLGLGYQINTPDTSKMGYAGGIIRIPYFDTNNINIVSVSAGYHHNAALDDQGRVYAWGYNLDRQVGKTGTSTGMSGYNSPQLVSGLPKIKKVSANNGYLDRGQTLAIDEAGNVWSWGSNLNGKHGVGTITNTASYQATPHKAQFPAGTVIVDVQGGDYHNIALDSQGDVWTWGYGTDGALGNGSAYLQLVPTKLNRPSGMAKALQISVSYGNNLLLDANNKVWQWGAVYQGPAAGNVTYVKTPRIVETDPAEITRVGYTPVATAVSTGESISYFIDQHGRSWAWGDNRYFGLGREGGYEDSNDVRLKMAQQWPREIGDGDTQIYDYSKKTPADGIKVSSKGTYGFNTLHPTIYDERYKNSAEDQVWIELAFKPIPKIKQIDASRSQYALLDYDGNIYKWGNDGSGSIAWGWDYDRQYDLTGNPYDGLYDKYTYEVMYMRGLPDIEVVEPVDPIEPIQVTFESDLEKIYQDPKNPIPETITVTAEISALPANTTETQKLQDMRYVFIPYDDANPDFNNINFTSADFELAYSSGLYQADTFLGGAIDATDTAQTITKSFTITKNGAVWILVQDDQVTHQHSFVADNFYTLSLVRQRGRLEFSGIPTSTVYGPTRDNVVKINAAGDTSSTLGVPLDAKGNAIPNTTFGFDKVEISKYETLPNNGDLKYTFRNTLTAPQDESVIYELNHPSYSSFIHDFYYINKEN